LNAVEDAKKRIKWLTNAKTKTKDQKKIDKYDKELDTLNKSIATMEGEREAA
jgi:predicted  nucleic acid-binding Zn-ribbon protein